MTDIRGWEQTGATWVPPKVSAPVAPVVNLNPIMTVNAAGDTLTITVTLRDGTMKSATLALT